MPPTADGMRRNPAAGWRIDVSRAGNVGRVRLVTGFLLALVLPVAAEFLLQLVAHDYLATDVLVQLAVTVAVAIIGGLWPALVAALWCSLILNFFSADPVGTLAISAPENVLTILVFVAVAVAVSLVVGLAARRTREASMAQAEAEILSALARSVLAGTTNSPTATLDGAVEDFLDQVRAYFQADGAALFIRDGGRWVDAGAAGPGAPSSPDSAGTLERIDDELVLAVTGHPLSPRNRRLLTAFGSHLLAMRQREQLLESQRDNLRLVEGNTMRTAILRAVSHDLRTPLAGIKLAATSLRQPTVELSPQEQQELLGTIDQCADRLDALIANLLDMSRISGDSVNPLLRPVSWLDAIDDALRNVATGRIHVDLPSNMPLIDADAGMLERVLANILENALRHAPDSEIVIHGSVAGSVAGSAAGVPAGTGSAAMEGRPASELRIIDHGDGVPAARLAEMFQPFQRLGDVPSGSGIGLGLAVAKGFTEAMGGDLSAEPTPGGGLTMVVRLPISTGNAHP